MISLESQAYKSLHSALWEVHANEDTRSWERALRQSNSMFHDGFRSFLTHDIAKEIFGPDQEFGSLAEWLLDAAAWSKEKILKPPVEIRPVEFCLYLLWEQFNERLREGLRAGRLHAKVPDTGGVLAFLGGLSHCAVVEFKFEGIVPDLQVVAVVESPKSVFDFWGAIDQVDLRARNHLKRILATGEKLVWNRGVLVHVDRRHDLSVFGPTIDTLVLAELLGQEILEKESDLESVLEVGCGNGMLSATLAAGVKRLRELFAIDVEHQALSCTLRNINAAVAAAKLPPRRIYLITGSFLPGLLNRSFDLVVCNPPYVPRPAGSEAGVDAPYLEAVGGTELLHELVESAASLLSPSGFLLLMTSSLCLDEALCAIPKEIQVHRPIKEAGFEVVFDVEAVLENPVWLDELLRSGGLIERQGLYYHHLHPLWLSRRSFS